MLELDSFNFFDGEEKQYDWERTVYLQHTHTHKFKEDGLKIMIWYDKNEINKKNIVHMIKRNNR